MPPTIQRLSTGYHLLRLGLSSLLLLHGGQNWVAGVDRLAGHAVQSGWPAAVAYLAYAGELLAPLLLLANRWVQFAAGVVVVHMLVLTTMTHGFPWGGLKAQGGWVLELQALYVLCAIALGLMAPRRD